MQRHDQKAIFGATPEEFKDRVRMSLEQLEMKEEAPSVRRISMRMMLAAVLAVVVLAGTALAIAHRVSVLDMREGALEGAKGAVSDLTEHVFETEYIRYEPTELLIDKGMLLLVVEARAKDEEKYMLNTPWGNGGEELAEGKAWVTSDFWISSIGGEPSGGGTISDPAHDGMITYQFSMEMADAREGELEIVLGARDSLGDAVSEGAFTFSMTPIQLPEETVRFEGPFEMDYFTVDFVEFCKSDISLGMSVQYTYKADVSEEKKDELTFSSIRIEDPSGAKDVRTFEYESFEWMSEKVGEDRYLERSTWPAIVEWPEMFEMVAFYKETGEWSAPVALRTADAIDPMALIREDS